MPLRVSSVSDSKPLLPGLQSVRPVQGQVTTAIVTTAAAAGQDCWG